MKFSVGKIIWKTYLKILSITNWIFYISVLGIYFCIIRQAKLDFEQSMNFFLILCSVYLVICLVYNLINSTGFLTALLSGLALFFYFSYGYQLFSHVQTGIIDNNFSWSLPDSINNLIDFSIRGRVIDFLFWSGFVLSALITASQLERVILFFLAKRKIGFALEIVEEKKAKLMEKKRKYVEAQAKVKPPSTKQKIIIGIVCILLVGLIAFSPFLFEKLENKRYPIVWEKEFPGTWFKDCQTQCENAGKDPVSGRVFTTKPGEPRIASFLLEERNKEMILEVKIMPQKDVMPKFSLEIELKNPDKKTIIYFSKEELFKGSRRFNFTPDKKGEYTFKITPYSYGISFIRVSVRDIAKNK